MMLLEKKAITSDQLRQAKERVRIKGGYLSHHLIELGFLTDAMLATYLTCQYGYSYLPVRAYTISEEALRMVPAQIASDLSILPIEISDKLLTVAMADPLNKGVAAFLKQLSGCEIVIFVSSLREIRDGIHDHYHITTPPTTLDRSAHDTALRDDLSIPFVSSGLYSGPNRRRYRRLLHPLNAELAIYPQHCCVRIPNISMSGMLLASPDPITRGVHLALTIQLDRTRFVRGIIEVARSEPRKSYITYEPDMPQASNLHEIGTHFIYIPSEDQDILAAFLREHLGR
jgi:hypothetical protein